MISGKLIVLILGAIGAGIYYVAREAIKLYVKKMRE